MGGAGTGDPLQVRLGQQLGRLGDIPQLRLEEGDLCGGQLGGRPPEPQGQGDREPSGRLAQGGQAKLVKLVMKLGLNVQCNLLWEVICSD